MMTMADLVRDFQAKVPELVKQMKAADHHYSINDQNVYHLESDVFTHTMMVCLLAEMFKVSPLAQMACLLHDVGKPLSLERVDETRRTRFFGHEGISVFVGLDYLNHHNFSNSELLHLVQLVSLHTVLFKLVKPTATIQKDLLARFVGNKKLLQDLIMVSKCDALGRFTAPELKEEFPKENIDSFLKETVDQISEVQPRVTNKLVTVLVGPPMAGKSTWLKENRGDSLVICRDDLILEMAGTKDYNAAFRSLDQDVVDKEFEKRKIEAIKTGRDVIFDLTHMSVRSRRRSLAAFSKQYKKRAVVFYTAYEELLRRNEERVKSESKSISEYTLKTLMGAFMTPLYDEVDEIVSYFNLGTKDKSHDES
jgi:predicted kinase